MMRVGLRRDALDLGMAIIGRNRRNSRNKVKNSPNVPM
jgi:hypothetical protein